MSALDAVRAEWIKLRSVRITLWALLLLAAGSILLTAFASAGSHTEGGSPGQPGDNDIVLDSLAGLWFGQIAVAVLGVLAITSEYSSRLIRATIAAMPRRRTMLAAKSAVFAIVVAPVSLATSVACFLVGQELLQRNGFTYENGYPAESLSDGTTLRAVVGSATYLVLLAVFAFAVGAVLRHTAGAITAVLGLVLGPVIAISVLPERAADLVEKTSLMAAGVSMLQTVERPDNIPLAPWQGLAVVSAYAVVALLSALWLIERRDA